MAVTAGILNVLALVSAIGFVPGLAGAPAYAQDMSGQSRVRSGSPKLTALINEEVRPSGTYRVKSAIDSACAVFGNRSIPVTCPRPYPASSNVRVSRASVATSQEI